MAQVLIDIKYLIHEISKRTRQALTTGNSIPLNSLPKKYHEVHNFILLTWNLSTPLSPDSSPRALKLAMGHKAVPIAQGTIVCVCVLEGHKQWLWALCSFLQPFQMSQWPAVLWKGSSQLQVSLICSSHLLIERSLLGLVCIPVKLVWILFFPLLFNTVLHTRFLWHFWSHEACVGILVRFAFHS